MHELSLARDLLGAIERKLYRSNAQVVRVSVCSGRRPVRFAFRVVCEGTRIEGAELSITTRLVCRVTPVARHYRALRVGDAPAPRRAQGAGDLPKRFASLPQPAGCEVRALAQRAKLGPHDVLRDHLPPGKRAETAIDAGDHA